MKVRLFLWRCCQDILATNTNLLTKRIPVDPCCVRCGLIESVKHIMWGCSWARGVWSSANVISVDNLDGSFREWLGHTMEKKGKELMEKVGLIAWQIWNARNNLIFKNEYERPEVTSSKALALLEEYKKVWTTRKEVKMQRFNVKWAAPLHGLLKLNFDAAIDRQSGKVGIKIVGRDSEGNCVLAASKTFCNEWSPEMAEVVAAREAVSLASNERFQKVVIEGDAQVIIKALNKDITRQSPIQVIVDDCFFLSSNFEQISFSFCVRECNSVAHRLAKWAASGFSDEVWKDGGPPWISDLIVSDMSLFNQ